MVRAIPCVSSQNVTKLQLRSINYLFLVNVFNIYLNADAFYTGLIISYVLVEQIGKAMTQDVQIWKKA